MIVDVREPHEYAEGHIPGSILVPLGDVAAHIDRFPKTKLFFSFAGPGEEV